MSLHVSTSTLPVCLVWIDVSNETYVFFVHIKSSLMCTYVCTCRSLLCTYRSLYIRVDTSVMAMWVNTSDLHPHKCEALQYIHTSTQIWGSSAHSHIHTNLRLFVTLTYSHECEALQYTHTSTQIWGSSLHPHIRTNGRLFSTLTHPHKSEALRYTHTSTRVRLFGTLTHPHKCEALHTHTFAQMWGLCYTHTFSRIWGSTLTHPNKWEAFRYTHTSAQMWSSYTHTFTKKWGSSLHSHIHTNVRPIGTFTRYEALWYNHISKQM